MSKNLDLVRSIVADWERGDFASADWADPEIESGWADGPSPGARIGLAAMAETERDFLNAWADVRIEADAVCSRPRAAHARSRRRAGACRVAVRSRQPSRTPLSCCMRCAEPGAGGLVDHAVRLDASIDHVGVDTLPHDESAFLEQTEHGVARCAREIRTLAVRRSVRAGVRLDHLRHGLHEIPHPPELLLVHHAPPAFARELVRQRARLLEALDVLLRAGRTLAKAVRVDPST